MSLPVERSPAVASHAAGNLPGDVARDVAAAQAGDAEAFARLVNAHQALVLRLARGLAGRPEDAADLAQETFTRLYTSLPRFRFECAFSTWVYRIATNVGLDYVRRQRARRWLWHTAVEEGWEPPDTRAAMNPERHTLSGEIARRVQRALAALPARQRMVFELRHYQGLRLGLIAELLDTSEEVAKNALFRATRKLRADLVDLLEGGKR
ncbi:MAG: RNA polymerase sigma factor [Terriglobales bacterium]